eukprot:Skav205000  [mRNA]  locus=scaffold3521:51641:56874:- [translate_table: standard]
MALPKLDLEPSWNQVTAGSIVSVLADCVLWDPNHTKHLLRSACKKVLFVYIGELAKAEAYSLLQATIVSTEKGFRLTRQDGYVLAHQTPEADCVYRATEVCAGIGCLSRGLETAGVTIQATNEKQARLVEFQKLQGRTKVIHGNLGDESVIAAIHEQQEGPGIIAGGFSCQPWSALGDRGAAADQRSSSLVFILRAGFFTRAHTIILECVPGAGKDPDVHRAIQEFCAWTGFRKAECELALQQIMPARRDRWWCVLTSPIWPQIVLRPLPTMYPFPTIGELLPFCPQWGEHDHKQIVLDRYETRKHEQFGGIHAKIIATNGQLPTALHGWANQLQGCPCLCRSGPMSESRLEHKGLFAALVLMEGEFQTAYMGTLPQTRHLHPWELAVLHGMPPALDFSQGLRLGIAGLGQMASPVQSNWIVSQVLAPIETKLGVPPKMPEYRLGDHFKCFFNEMSQTQPTIVIQPAVQQFIHRLWNTLDMSLAANAVRMLPSWPASDQPTEPLAPGGEAISGVSANASVVLTGQNETIKRAGRQDLNSGDVNQPPVRTEEPTLHRQPADEMPGLIENDQATVGTEAALTDLAMPAKDGTDVSEAPSPPNHPQVVEAAAEPGSEPPIGMEREQENMTIERAGRKNLKRGRDNQPPVRTEAPNLHKQPADETQELKEEGCDPVGTIADVSPAPSVAHDHPVHAGHPPFDHHHLSSHASGQEITFADQLRQIGHQASIARSKQTTEPDGADAREECHVEVFSEHGGIQAFATATIQPEVTNEQGHGLTDTQVARVFTQQDDEAPTQLGPPATGRATDRAEPDAVGCHVVFVVRPNEHDAVEVRVPKDCTVGSVTQAEHMLGTIQHPIRVTNSVGDFIDPTTLTHDRQQLFLNVHPDDHNNRGTSHLCPSVPVFAHCCEPIPRSQLLYMQGPWVETTEYQFYLQVITEPSVAVPMEPLVVPEFIMDDELKDLMHAWAPQCMNKIASVGFIATAFLVHDHWFPVILKVHAFGTRMITTKEAADWVDIAFQAYTHNMQIQLFPLPWSVACDCGFQSIGWTQHHLQSIVTEEAITDAPAVSKPQAVQWREMYEAHLTDQGQRNHLVIPAALRFGGVSNGALVDFLQDLLSQHGVPSAVLAERAESILDALGRGPVQQAMRSAHQWRDLKALANQHRPKVQLVLAGELENAIQDRLQTQQEFGHKKKKRATPVQDKLKLQITPSDVSIPDGIFREFSGDLIKQIPLVQIGPETKGVVVVDHAQAVPYANHAKPVSTRGLAMLILDSPESSASPLGEIIRFPARCERTGEPIILAARLLQLGTIMVVRHSPENIGAVEEEDTTVVRVLTYREETDMSWATFTQKPVKHVLDMLPELQSDAKGEPRVLDCWDRQFLSLKLTKALMAQSGVKACYVEPRDITGRIPSSDFRVVWLNKHDKASARLALQSSPEGLALVRSGQRFGIRVAVKDAAVVHNRHKPQTPFLATAEVRTFQVGPWPYGATKASIHKVFQSWKWSARPVQPKGRSATGTSLMWEVQACEAPAYEVWQLSHGDILVTEVPRKAKPAQSSAAGVQGSQRTIAALSVVAQKQGKDDPWQQEGDPWQSYERTNKQPRLSTPSSASRPQQVAVNVEAIAAQVEEKVIANLAKSQPPKEPQSDDELMADDPRVQALESRLNQLELTVQQQHTAQAAHNQAIARQVDQVQQQVDHQAEAMRSHLDQRMNEQLGHIEQLLKNKHQRTE